MRVLTEQVWYEYKVVTVWAYRLFIPDTSYDNIYTLNVKTIKHEINLCYLKLQEINDHTTELGIS